MTVVLATCSNQRMNETPVKFYGKRSTSWLNAQSLICTIMLPGTNSDCDLYYFCSPMLKFKPSEGPRRGLIQAGEPSAVFTV